MKLPRFVLLGLGLGGAVVAQTLPPPATTPIEAMAPRAPLSETTLRKIAGMTPIFDGRTLDGWIQAPVAPFRFATEDVKNFAALAQKLSSVDNGIGRWLAAQLDDAGRTALTAPATTPAETRAAITAVLRTLNRVVAGDASIYDETRFNGVALRPETEALRRTKPRDLALARLNRMLLEDAFPAELARSPAASWVVKDSALASTGACRGVIYTARDFSHYRLVLQVRQISGNHVPGVLVFCARPATRGDLAEAQAGIDALGAVQFQVPNGGHWDYRPGFNRAGEHFNRPARIRFNLNEWAQVELLVNAKTGVARMAVAQPVGTRAIEILVFNDPAAGKPGPIALQMHNAGLFDEYRALRIEIDPREDRLLTVE